MGNQQRQEKYRNAVEYLCANLAALTDETADLEWEQQIKALKDATVYSDPWYAAVDRLQVLAEGAGTGTPGGLGLTSTMGGLPGSRPDTVTGWLCPTQGCTRVELGPAGPGPAGAGPAAAAPAPVCALFETPMRFLAV